MEVTSTSTWLSYRGSISVGLHITELVEGSDTPETVVLDLTDDEVKKFKIGQKVTITIKGSVGMLSVPP